MIVSGSMTHDDMTDDVFVGMEALHAIVIMGSSRCIHDGRLTLLYLLPCRIPSSRTSVTYFHIHLIHSCMMLVPVHIEISQ